MKHTLHVWIEGSPEYGEPIEIHLVGDVSYNLSSLLLVDSNHSSNVMNHAYDCQIPIMLQLDRGKSKSASIEALIVGMTHSCGPDRKIIIRYQLKLRPNESIFVGDDPIQTDTEHPISTHGDSSMDITFRLDDQHIRTLGNLCLESDMTKNEIFREALKCYDKICAQEKKGMKLVFVPIDQQHKE